MSDRNELGQFAPGNPGGPGRPSRATEAHYLEATLATVSVAQWQQIVAKAVEQAVAGDAKARDFLAKYLLPMPGEQLQAFIAELQRASETLSAADTKSVIQDLDEVTFKAMFDFATKLQAKREQREAERRAAQLGWESRC